MENNNGKTKTERATFGAGCFWCVEAIFSRVNGVMNIQPGYSGGTVKKISSWKADYRRAEPKEFYNFVWRDIASA